ncbi:hypothetical protein B4168_2703 [Anoxybacillus flavithermus]|nr:hypothetical protein B4168_2703 [Anoxybacillus flavithermus]OAO87468.1 hypothetical protein GT23_1117 [Parageobacillus thermoglucosidasius]
MSTGTKLSRISRSFTFISGPVPFLLSRGIFLMIASAFH